MTLDQLIQSLTEIRNASPRRGALEVRLAKGEFEYYPVKVVLDDEPIDVNDDDSTPAVVYVESAAAPLGRLTAATRKSLRRGNLLR